MRRLTRIAVAAAAAALASAGSAAAALNATLTVGTGSPGLAAVNVSVAFDHADPPVGRVVLYVPNGYTPNLPTKPNTHVGTADGIVFVTDVNGDEHMKGSVVVANTGDGGLSKQTLAEGCAGATHAAWWVVNLVGNANWSIPLFVDRTTGTETRFGAWKLTLCMQPPTVPPNGDTSNRADNGQRLITLNLGLTALANPTAPGDVRWRSLVTAYAPNALTLDSGSSVEAQSVLSLPQRLTLGVRRHGGTATLTGSLTANGKGVASTAVQLEVSKTKKRLSPFARVQTNAAGVFTKTFALKGVRWFRADVTTPTTSLGAGACTPSFGAAVPCVSATAGRSHLLTSLVRIG